MKKRNASRTLDHVMTIKTHIGPSKLGPSKLGLSVMARRSFKVLMTNFDSVLKFAAYYKWRKFITQLQNEKQ